ncbi:MAG: 1,4-dihydroxy-2-naphthoate polyprenyltransferase [Bacillota bacterium]
MSLAAFAQFVEVQTKLASIIPFALGSLYALYRYHSFRFDHFIIMFVSLISFDMATTAINNYIDYTKARETEGYNFKQKNAIGRYGIKESTARATIFTLLAVAVIFGIILTIKTSIVVLLVGALSFAVGIFYTFGPIPISRMPLGEAFSGLFMGFIIPFLAIYIHIYDQGIIAWSYQSGVVSFSINIVELALIFLLSIPAVGGIANIMLANNICDVDEDIINNRFTLPYYIGRKNAIRLFQALYYIGYIDLIILVALRIVPWTSLLVLLTLIPVGKNIHLFSTRPIKGETFVLSVKNFAIMNLAQALVVAAMLVLGRP